MKKQSIVFLLLLASLLSVSANDKDRFGLTFFDMPVVLNSLYHTALFLDDRSDYEFDRIKIDKSIFDSQLSSLMGRITDRTAKYGVLFLQLRNLYLGKDKESGEYARLRITLYEQREREYYFINTIDRKISLKKSNDFQENVSKEITEIISETLTKAYTDPKPYSINELKDIAFFEKENKPLYNTNSFIDGIYSTFSDFVNQKADQRTIIPKFKNNELKEIKIINSTNKKERKISPELIYAVVLDGRPYITTDKKFIPLQKDNDDFFFEDEVSSNRVGIMPSFSVGIGSGGYRGGGIGIGVVTHSQKVKFLFKIDHLTGDFMPVSIIQ